MLATLLLGIQFLPRSDLDRNVQASTGTEEVVPVSGIELPVVWGDLGKQLVELGVIDRERFSALYSTLSEEERRLLDGNNPERLRITPENAPYLLNLFWAFGLVNTNPILEDETEMMNPAYGGAGGFASTGGWTLARGPSTGSGQGDAMEHYNMHSLVTLTPERQALVEKVSKNIYRPCCGNSTHFPDCNHGIAMLSLLEILASQGVGEDEMYKAALAVNSYWFPDTYQTIAVYMQQKGIAWENVSPKEVLGVDYSSASGFARVAAEVAPRGGSGASCGV
ncbi:hypothetical protein A2853_04050 [Candidatus Kaiserbacteria bacterium RIFCSPHIGHO2_01_FULL_55_17]|uniref:Uncharacterized protein n=1 Tax=Candidatus Kaiserbacteria bacterium RIFCSPHIGHO2_01_FULL_55_17 TaxID=1798484 RepID=A0A1F6D7U7_9BACT|nr:MAG: hypothetical protein A2853_04050 [Candidatus Kaiserbacteria bacterium RIFCSPHIGHO2_01_FULL_55_17]